jgi:hypothetical protein
MNHWPGHAVVGAVFNVVLQMRLGIDGASAKEQDAIVSFARRPMSEVIGESGAALGGVHEE